MARLASIFTLTLCLCGGCVNITDHSTTRFDPWTQRDLHYTRDGHVFCVRGLFGIWSRGVDIIADRLRAELKVHAQSAAGLEWHRLAGYLIAEHQAGHWSGPLVLVGHSFGADDQISVAWALARQSVPIDLMVLLDPVKPANIPPNVRRCVDIYKSHPGLDTIPAFRGIIVAVVDPRRTKLENIDLRQAPVGFDTTPVDHFNIEKTRGVQDMVLAEVAKTCPVAPRR